MKSMYRIKCRKAALALGILFACGAAQAQPSVVLYGGIDANIEYVNHYSTAPDGTGPGKNLIRMNSGGLSGSRFGLRGTEDLGGGLKTVFVLESGFNVDDGTRGQGGRMFGRQAYIGIDSEQFGRFTFGRQYVAWFWALANFSPTFYANQYEPDVTLVGLDYRADNMLMYTKKFGPVTAIFDFSLGTGTFGNGENPGQFHRDTAYGGALTYDSGPFSATLAANQLNPTLTAAGGTGAFKKVAVAASYTFDERAKLMAGYRWGRATDASGLTIMRDDSYWAGVNYNLNPQVDLTLSYFYDDIKQSTDKSLKNPWQITFVADYHFSKRTDVYLTTAYTKNAGLNFDTSATGFANGYPLGTGQSSMFGVAVGVRHNF